MRCKNCGNELNEMQFFCGNCGSKVENEHNIKTNTDGVKVAVRQMDKRKILYIVILAAISIFIIFTAFTVIRTASNRTFSPIGIWKSTDTPMQLKFKRGGELQVGGFGAFTGDLHWEEEGDNSFYISGNLPEIAGISIGELGWYMYYDAEDKSLSMDLEGDIFVFEKVR